VRGDKEVIVVRPFVRHVLFWTPRALGLLFAGFLSLLALDVFGAGYRFWETFVALLIHLAPTVALLGVLALSWRWPLVGAVGFIGFAAWYLATFATWPANIFVDLQLAGLPLLLGILFLMDWWYGISRRRRATPAGSPSP
jgi:hypothetical protein